MPLWKEFSADMKEVFLRLCAGRDQLDREGYKLAVVTLLGFKPSKVEMQRVFPLGIVGLSFDRFEELMEAQLCSTPDADLVRQVFIAFDVLGRGFLLEEDVVRAFREVCPLLPPSVAREVFRELDSDADKRVGFREVEAALLSYGSSSLE